MAPPTSPTPPSPPAAEAAEAASTQPATPASELPSGPLPLSASQEAQVRALYHANVRARCGREIEQFAACARNRTVTVTWRCRAQRLAMNSCMVAHATVAEEDRAREQWLRGGREAQRRERERESERVEQRRREVIELIRTHEVKEREQEQEREKRGGDNDGGGGGPGRGGSGFWGSVRR